MRNQSYKHYRKDDIDLNPTAVCGSDNRGETGIITNQSQANRVATTKLIVEFKDIPEDQRFWWCSAAYVSSKRLVTAAHCLTKFHEYPEAKLKRVYVIPGAYKQNGDVVEPFGRQIAKIARYSSLWAEGDGSAWDHDWGYLIMRSTDQFERMNRKKFILKPMSDSELENQKFAASGYPEDRDQEDGFVQAFSIYELLTNKSQFILKSKVDIFPGTSGDLFMP